MPSFDDPFTYLRSRAFKRMGAAAATPAPSPAPTPTPTPDVTGLREITMTVGAVGWGSSSTYGRNVTDGVPVTKNMWNYLDDNSTNVIGTGAADIENQGVTGDTSAQVRTRMVAATATQKAKDAILQFGGNGLTNWTFDTSVDDANTEFNTAIGATGLNHNRWLAWTGHNQSNDGWGAGEWVPKRVIARHKRVTAEALPVGEAVYVDFHEIVRDMANLNLVARGLTALDATDTTNIANDVFPTSYRANAGADGSHGNTNLYNLYSQLVIVPVEEARNGGRPFLPPYHKLISNLSTANDAGGLVGYIPHVGSLTGATFSLQGSAFDFAVTVEGGRVTIRRVAGGELTGAGLRRLTVRATKAGYYWDFTIDVGVGATSAAPKRVEVAATYPDAATNSADNRMGPWLARYKPFDGVANGTQLSAVFDLEFVGATALGSTQRIFTSLTAASSPAARLQIEKQSTGAVRALVRDTAGANIGASSPSVTAAFSSAGVRRWIFLWIDTNAGVMRMAVDDTLGTNVAPSVAGTVIDFNSGIAAILAGDRTGGSLPKCRVGTIWMANSFIDFSVSGNRQLFRTAADAPVTLGTNGLAGGVTPFLYMRGNAADMLNGRNFGTGGDLICVDRGGPLTV